MSPENEQELGPGNSKLKGPLQYKINRNYTTDDPAVVKMSWVINMDIQKMSLLITVTS